jgi:hypothetical protein
MKTCLIIIAAMLLAGCASIVSQATSGLADNLGVAILNQDDPATVRDGAPAYLLMLDSFVHGSPDNPDTLMAAAELYAAYGVLFAEDASRASRLTSRARDYGERALCATNRNACDIGTLPFAEYQQALEKLGIGDTEALYTYSLAWFGWVKVNSSDMLALAQLPRAEAAMRRVHALDPDYRTADVEHYLGVLSTIRPPALGGRFDEGRAHFERSIALTDGKDLATKVDFARFYARTLYNRELHDQLLNEVLATDPQQFGFTLFNVIAHQEAAALLASADDYF